MLPIALEKYFVYLLCENSSPLNTNSKPAQSLNSRANLKCDFEFHSFVAFYYISNRKMGVIAEKVHL